MTRRALLAFALAKSLLLPDAAVAVDPGYYVVTAYDNAGVAAADFRYWTVRPPGEPTVIWPEAGLGTACRAAGTPRCSPAGSAPPTWPRA